MTKHKAICLGVLVTISAFTTFAQQPQRQPTPNDTLVSPEVHADNRVTFRIYAPKAGEVTVGAVKSGSTSWGIRVAVQPPQIKNAAASATTIGRCLSDQRISPSII